MSIFIIKILFISCLRLVLEITYILYGPGRSFIEKETRERGFIISLKRICNPYMNRLGDKDMKYGIEADSSADSPKGCEHEYNDAVL